EGAVRRVRGRGGLRLLLRRRGRAVRRLRPPRPPRQQARRQAPPPVPPPPIAGLLLVAFAEAASLRHLPGEEGAPVLQGGQGDPVPGVRRPGAHGQRADEAARPVPAHRRARLVGAGGVPRAVGSGGGGEQHQPLHRRLLQRRRQWHGERQRERERRQQHLRVPDQDAARVARRGLPPGRRRRRRLLEQAVSGQFKTSSQGGGLARIGGPQEGEGYPAWAGQEQLIGGVVVAAGERASRELWVPQMHAGAAWAGSKRPRPSSLGSSSYW
uniref:Uncharacterized protein n=1 Tax=Aegilops tauschii subsp. strangulata TaxID=200361 RepID=A0A453CJA9_AEGTS